MRRKNVSIRLALGVNAGFLLDRASSGRNLGKFFLSFLL